MSQGLEEWAEENDALYLWNELETHSKYADGEDFARLAMISIRQWVEAKKPPASGGQK